jgi:hypothetical protein
MYEVCARVGRRPLYVLYVVYPPHNIVWYDGTLDRGYVDTDDLSAGKCVGD